MPNYKLISFFYDFIDVLYFNHPNHNPRTTLIDAIPDTQIRILDMCAGTCSNSILVAKNKPQSKIVALDLSEEMLRIAENKFLKAGINNIEILVTDACNTGLSDSSFDIILLSLVLHEVNEELQKSILCEAKRLLNDDGQIIVIEWEQPSKLFQRFMFALTKRFEPKGFKEFLRKKLTDYFENSGFVVIDKRSCDYTQVIRLSK